jgi:hypothetical protein
MRAMIFVLMLHAMAAARPSAPSQQMRTYVSGSGSDNNACTATSPCKTFQVSH